MPWLAIAFISILILGGGYMTIEYITTSGKYNDNYDLLFLKYSKEQGIDARLLKAIAMNESGVQMNYTHLEPKGGTTGIMHIKLSTAQDYEKSLSAKDLENPETQIRVASKHIKRLLKVFNNDIDKTVMAYNAGEGNIKRGYIPKTTKDYIARYYRNIERLGVVA